MLQYLAILSFRVCRVVSLGFFRCVSIREFAPMLYRAVWLPRRFGIFAGDDNETRSACIVTEGQNDRRVSATLRNVLQWFSLNDTR